MGIEVLKYLAVYCPNHYQAMIEYMDYFAIFQAIKSGSLEVTLWLMRALNDTKKQHMIKENGFYFFRSAFEQKHWDLATFFISYPVVFAKALENPYRYRSYIAKFIRSEIHAIRSDMTMLENETQTLLYFNMLRYLIEHSPQTLEPDMRLLMRCPSISPAQINELFELAQEKNNKKALRILLETDEFHEAREFAEATQASDETFTDQPTIKRSTWLSWFFTARTATSRIQPAPTAEERPTDFRLS